MGIDLRNFFTENIPAEPYTEWNTEIVRPWVHLLGSTAACIAFIRSTEYVTRTGAVRIHETEETLIWLKRSEKWKVIHFHSGLIISF